MAAQVSAGRSSLRILDPAAGSGTLLCAVVERLALTDGALHELDLVAYETDSNLQSVLATILDDLKRWSAKRRITVHTKLEKQDFVLAHAQTLRTTGHLFNSQKVKSFDLVIANPPYFKISKSDPRAQAAISVVHGQPNIYALFMAASAALLHEGGELIFITPRSFTSGPYFRLFRKRFFARLRPASVHIFDSRRKAFGRDEVLQENIIMKGVRNDGWESRDSPFKLWLSSSDGIADLGNPAGRSIALEDAIRKNDADRVFSLPILKDEDEAVRRVGSWTGSLHKYGMNISTGPVVPFRATEFLDEADLPTDGCVPLIWMNHVHAMRVSFPNGTRKPQYIKKSASERSLLLPSRNYVLLRRFSAKEESRRLVAAPWLKRVSAYPLIGIENHLNYIHRPGGELDEDEALGLAALLNSALLDTYFRISSGNTQVSATELRALPLPPRAKIALIGRHAKGLDSSGERLEEIVEEAVGVRR